MKGAAARRSSGQLINSPVSNNKLNDQETTLSLFSEIEAPSGSAGHWDEKCPSLPKADQTTCC